MRTFLKILGVFALVSALVALSLITYDFTRSRGVFPFKTFIAGIDVSLLSYEEALTKLKKHSASKLLSPLITLEAGTDHYCFPPEKFGIHIQYEATIKNAIKKTQGGNYLQRLKERLLKEAVSAPLVLDVDQEQLKVVFESLASEVDTLPKDASIIFYEKTGGYHIRSEIPGKKINIEKSIVSFTAGISAGERALPLVIDYTEPHIKEGELRAHPPVYRLSTYTTYYGKHDSPNRIHNIQLVSSWIDGTLMLPGDIFSVADLIGDVTEEQGFKEAFVIIKGELVPLQGGGSCQIATTLYNAVSLADLKIVARRNHSFYFNIYPLGRDSAVYPGQIDLKFENDTPYPILLKSVATKHMLSFSIYGSPSRKKVKFSSAKVYGRSESGNFVPMSLKEVIEKDLPFKTEITRTVYENNQKVKEEIIRSSYKLYGDKENVPIKKPEPR